VRAAFCRAGRPDLAGEFVRLVRCPTLLVVGETDGAMRELNERAEPQFPRTARLAQVPGASVLREEPEAWRSSPSWPGTGSCCSSAGPGSRRSDTEPVDRATYTVSGEKLYSRPHANLPMVCGRHRHRFE